MHEILRHLPQGSFVLDLGSGAGSFNATLYPIFAVRLDLERPPNASERNLVQADAASLPFRAGSFQAVVCNHSLEHVQALDAALREVGRVLKRDGGLYVAVPDCTTVSDRLYRWLARGGGHVNAFSSLWDLVSKVELNTGLRHVATRPLCTSLSFLNSRNQTSRPPKKLLLVGGGSESVLLLVNVLFRLCDRLLGTRMAIYGWASYFGVVGEPVSTELWTNVCVRCGAGHPSNWLILYGAVASGRLFHSYSCPACGARNVFSRDDRYRNLK
ncbi:MAG: class I SAM-dependent methyltransferase [Acidobacteria bacterium]|nr:class I SAM-dependent methyltransferase [Acidobacteriota bacterium]